MIFSETYYLDLHIPIYFIISVILHNVKMLNVL